MTRLTTGFIALALPFAVAAQVETYNIDPYHTIPYWETDHLGYATLRGLFSRTTGKFTIDRAARTGTLEITIQTASLHTGDTDREARSRARDEHLRSPDFFNVAEFQTMTYRATRVTFAGDNPDVVEGELTLLGVTKPVALKIERWRCGPDPRTVGKRYQCGGNATGSFKRSDFGMKFGLPTAIGDEVKLWMSFYGFRSQ